jgi:hypothetical protein
MPDRARTPTAPTPLTPAELAEIAREHEKHDPEPKWSGTHSDAHAHRGKLLAHVDALTAELAERTLDRNYANERADRARRTAEQQIEDAGLRALYDALSEDNWHSQAMLVQRTANTVAEYKRLAGERKVLLDRASGALCDAASVPTDPPETGIRALTVERDEANAEVARLRAALSTIAYGDGAPRIIAAAALIGTLEEDK